jgi:hypothetical protein
VHAMRRALPRTRLVHGLTMLLPPCLCVGPYAWSMPSYDDSERWSERQKAE